MSLLKKIFHYVKGNGLKYTFLRFFQLLFSESASRKQLLRFFQEQRQNSISHNPSVSIIAVNFNGADDLPVFLEAVLNQSYQDFELLIVDNGSQDGSVEIIKHYLNSGRVRLLEAGCNLGFAAGNNYAQEHCKGEMIALINVDTKPDKDWLKELVDAILLDSTVGAACSKTLFWERFQDVTLESDKDFEISLKELEGALVYKKYFIREGVRDGDSLLSKSNRVVISLPIQDELINIKFIELKNDLLISLKVGRNRQEFVKVKPGSSNLTVNFSQSAVVNSTYLVNNAGSVKLNGSPADRGFGEYDIGQYDSKQYVDYFCGVSVLIRRWLVVNRKLFVDEFFAYYEDSELSRFINREGYRILYAPRSVLYHRHSATSNEGSPLWSLLVSRSQKIFSYEDGKKYNLYDELVSIEDSYKEKVNPSILGKLRELSIKIGDRLSSGEKLFETIPSIGIYNSYWNTKGGGESHALSIAEVLQKRATVYLISESDFSVEELAKYYDLDLSNCVKLVEEKITPKITEKFELFINSTYGSNLVSHAKKSLYIVSFPHKNIYKPVLKSYYFLYNSKYTKRWSEKYWGKQQAGQIVYPLGMLEKSSSHDENFSAKEKIILSVGRFFVGAHCKNQLVLAKVFKQLVESGYLSGWKLVLIGSYNASNTADTNYVNQIYSVLDGLNHQIILNSSRNVLSTFYSRAYMYVHAAGFGQDPIEDPSKFEHFGITPVEAMTKGCFPIVYGVGGPADLLSDLSVGRTYDSIETLGSVILEEAQSMSELKTSEVSLKARDFLLNNDVRSTVESL